MSPMPGTDSAYELHKAQAV